MIGITNVGGGGGMAYAYIGVIYDAGATVTCTDGNKTYRAKDTSGLYTFPVPYAGTWVVTATDGTQTKSESVVITSLWQDVVADLSFWDGTIFYNGDQYLNITGGWEYNPNLYYSTNKPTTNVANIDTCISFSLHQASGSCYVQTLSKVDLTNVVSIDLLFKSATSTSGLPVLTLDINSNNAGMTSSSTDYYSIRIDTSTVVNYEYTVGLRKTYNDEYYLAAGVVNNGSDVEISKIKLNYA